MTRKASILVLDADPAFVRQVEETLTTAGHQMTVVDQEADALAKVRGQAFDMAIVDLERTGTGAAFLEEMKRSSVETPVAITGARLTVEAVVAAMRRGAWDVLRKPVTGEDVLRLAQRAARIKELGKERSRAAEDLQSERARNAELRRSLQGQHALTPVLRRSPEMKQHLHLLR